MTDNEQHDELDRVLHAWAERRQAETDLEPLAQRIVGRIGEEAPGADTARPNPAEAVPAGIFHRPTLWIAAGSLALTLLILCGILLNRDNTGGDSPVRADLSPQFAWLEKSQLAEKSALLRELDEIFDDRLQWLAETNGRVLLEVQDQSQHSAGSRDTGTFVVRVVVARANSEATGWTPVWAADVVTGQENVVRLSTESNGAGEGAELSLWVYPVDEHMIAVDTSLSLDRLQLESIFSGVQESGIPLPVHAAEWNNSQYKVFQTVVRLNGEA